MFLVSCPKCKNKMNYQPKGNSLKGKKKRCVYCGHVFTVHSDSKKSRIVKKI